MSPSHPGPSRDGPDLDEFRRLPSRIRALIEEPKRLSALNLWRTLEDREKTIALRGCFRDRGTREILVERVAEARHFRKKTVQRWSEEKLVETSRRVTPNLALAFELLLTLHMDGRREMLGTFYDQIGLPHDDGDPDPGAAAQPFDEGPVHAAADRLAREHGLRRTVVFFLFAAVLGHPYADHLIGWMALRSSAKSVGEDPGPVDPPAEETRDETDPGLAPETADLSETAPAFDAADAPGADVDGGAGEADAPVSDAPAPQPPQPVEEAAVGDEALDEAEDDDEAEHEGDAAPHGSFTTLDDLLVRAMVDSKQGIEGCLDEDEIDDAVDEFVSLNGRRPHSCYHLGFRDVLFKGGASPHLPVPGNEQSRWYWAGAIAAWERSESWTEIATAYDDREHVRALGDGRDFATEEAAHHVVHALRAEGRAAEVRNFARVPALVRSPALFEAVLNVGTELLYDGEEGAARAVLRELKGAVKKLEREGEAPASRRFLNVRRRHAHCLQRANEHDRARRSLASLIELESDSNHQAMVYADLGLLESRFNTLADVSLPRGAGELPDLIDRLEEGREQFQRAVRNDVHYAAHGHYCLGVAALAKAAHEARDDAAEARFIDAERHLLRARNRFGSRRDSYGEELVERTNLYFGIAVGARITSAGDAAHAARIIVAAAKAGARFPSYLIGPLVAALEVSAAEKLEPLAEALLATGDGEALDALSRSDGVARRCAAVPDALRERAQRRGRSKAAAADYRVCLDGYIGSRRREDAEAVLDRLEALAVHGIGVTEFEELLAREGEGELPWAPEEASIAQARCCEAVGKLDDAVTMLRPLFHQYATDGNLDDAVGVLERMSLYGLPAEYLERERNRARALRKEAHVRADADVSPAGERPSKPVCILFVGGDERQAKDESAVHELLHQRDPSVKATFIHPGWDGNWNIEWQKVRRALPEHDAVVLMRFMRTQLGRQIRKHCDKPWRFCWARGRSGMTNAIIEAAEAARGTG